MRSRAKRGPVAVFGGKLVKSNFPKDFLRFYFTLVNRIGMSVTPGDIRFIMSSSSFNVDCNGSRDPHALDF